MAVWAVLRLLTLASSLAQADAAPFAYVTNSNSNNVSVIDPATQRVVATVDVGQTPLGIAISPDGSHIYVANNFGNSISVIDTSRNAVVATIQGVMRPIGVAVTPDGKRLYAWSAPQWNSISVIDTATNQVVSAVSVEPGVGCLAFTPNGATGYYTVDGANYVKVIETGANTVVSTVTLGNTYGSACVALSPDGKRAYVTNGGTGVVVIDPATNMAVATVPLGLNPGGVAVTLDGTRAYVRNFYPEILVSVLDTANNAVLMTIGGLGKPGNAFMVPGISLTPDSTFAYVTSMQTPVSIPACACQPRDQPSCHPPSTDSAVVINLRTNQVVCRIPVGQRPHGVVITPPSAR
jgi:YVTN family beta-propeller protein